MVNFCCLFDCMMSHLRDISLVVFVREFPKKFSGERAIQKLYSVIQWTDFSDSIKRKRKKYFSDYSYYTPEWSFFMIICQKDLDIDDLTFVDCIDLPPEILIQQKMAFPPPFITPLTTAQVTNTVKLDSFYYWYMTHCILILCVSYFHYGFSCSLLTFIWV